MSFLSPKWQPENKQYFIETTETLRAETRVAISKDTTGSTVFTATDEVHNITTELVHDLIEEGDMNKWFSKLPTHEQLMKRINHTFSKLSDENNNMAYVNNILMTPKLLTIVWTPITVKANTGPQMYFDETDDSEGMESEPEVENSRLPPVALRQGAEESQEEYLLTRLRAARARVEAEQIKMQYFETTGRMPPDSESEDD
jgi:hypothetical protein